MSLVSIDIPAIAGQLLDFEVMRASVVAGDSLSSVYRLALADD